MSITSKMSLGRLARCSTALALILLSGCMPAGPRALLQGERLIREGQYESAVKKLRVATEFLPQNAQAWNHLGLAYHGARQPAKAIQAYQQALQINRDLAAARFNLGCLFLEVNNPGEAVVHLTTFTLLQPRDPEGWVKLGVAQLELRQWASAKASYEQALALGTRSPEAWNGLGMLALQQGRPRDAFTCFASALQFQSNFPPALLNQAIVCQQYLKNRPLALQKYREYLAAKPIAANVPAVQTIVHQLEAELKPPAPVPVPAPMTNAVAQLAAHTNAPALAVSNALPAHAAATVASNALAASGAHLSNPPAVPIPSPKPEPPKRTNDLMAAVPRRADTNSLRLAATDLPPRLTNALPISPKPQAKPEFKPAPKPEPVVREVAKSVPVQPLPPPTVVQLAPEPKIEPAVDRPAPVAAANFQTNPPGATGGILTTNDVARAQPPLLAPMPPPEKHSLLSRVNPANWFRSKSRTEAPAFKTVTGGVDAPKPRIVSDKPALASRNAPRPQVAAVPEPPAVARYSYRNPPKPAAGNRAEAERLLAKGYEQQRQGDWNLAVASYHKASATDPSYFAAHYQLGLAYYQSGQLAQSLLEYELALAVDPSAPDARYNFALALQKANYPRDAVAELNRAVAKTPNDARLHLLLANLYAQQLAQPESARPHYDKVLELDPQNAQAAAIRYWLSANP